MGGTGFALSFLSCPLHRRCLAYRPRSPSDGRSSAPALEDPLPRAWLPPGTPSPPKNGGSLAFPRMLALKGKRGNQAGCESGSAGSLKSPRFTNASFVWDLGKARLPELKVSIRLQFVTKLHFKVSHSLLTLLPKALVSIVPWGLKQSRFCIFVKSSRLRLAPPPQTPRISP